MRDPADDRLLAGLVEGRSDAFSTLYDRYSAALFRVAWTMLRSRLDAEDAVQEVFLGLVRSRTLLRQVENLRSYLFSSLRHAVARIGARRVLEKLPAIEMPKRSESVGVDAETSFLLEQGLASLPAEQREVVSLKIDGDLTFAEVAEVLGIRLNTAASRYRYALEKLRAILDANRHETRPAATRMD